MLKFIGAVTCVGFVALVLVVLYAVGGSHGSSSGPAGDPGSASLGPAMRVSAMKLALDYHENEVQADNLYRGKHLLVRGLVTSISKDALDNAYLVLASDNEFMQVHANLQASEAGAAANLHTMQVVNVDCVGGEMVIGSPQLDNCAIVSDEPVASPPSPTEPQVSSDASTSDESSNPSPSGPATDQGTEASKDSVGTDASPGEVHEEQAAPQQPAAQGEQTPPQQPPAPIERH